MAFYDANAESQKTLTPLQQALVFPPDVVLHHQDLLTSITKTANFSDEKAEYILDILLKNIQESLSYNNPSNSRTSLIILDYCIRNGTIFAQYVFGRYILQKLYLICSRDLTKVQSNHKEHQQFQYQLIGTILTWHQMYSNIPGSTLNYTFSRLQKSGIVALYQSYKQTQSLFNPNNQLVANSQQNLPNLPPSPQPQSGGDIDEKQSDQFKRARSMTTNPISSSISSNAQQRPRSQSESATEPTTTNQRVHQLDGAKLVERDGTVTLEYTEKFLLEINELVTRYLKPTREILSRQKINLANAKLSKYLQILQTVQQRLVKVISEVKNDDGVVSLAIRANDCIVDTILWFNSLVKKSKQKHKKGQPHAVSAPKNVLENIDLVGLEQQLLMDNANLVKQQQLRKEKEEQAAELEKQKKKEEDEQPQVEKEKEVVVKDDSDQNNGNVPQAVPVQAAADFDLMSADNAEAVEQEEDKDKPQEVVDIISEPQVVQPPIKQEDKAKDNSFSSISLNTNKAQVSVADKEDDTEEVQVIEKEKEDVSVEVQVEKEQDVEVVEDANVEDVVLEQVDVNVKGDEEVDLNADSNPNDVNENDDAAAVGK
eukprot:242199_1